MCEFFDILYNFNCFLQEVILISLAGRRKNNSSCYENDTWVTVLLFGVIRQCVSVIEWPGILSTRFHDLNLS